MSPSCQMLASSSNFCFSTFPQFCAEIQTVDVAVIGNGPAGITMSYLLSGYLPYYNPNVSHSNPFLHEKLMKQLETSIAEQVLFFFF